MTDLSSKQLVRDFLLEVRSGKNADAASKYLAPVVKANQVVSEESLQISRTPAQYAEHVREMLDEYGNFEFEIEELICENDRVYARWNQFGKGIRAVTSCVYRIEAGLIVEYWIQIDRLGIELHKS